MARSKHILPFLLEGDVQEIDSTSSNQAWNQLTSFVNIDNEAAIDFTVGEPKKNVPGALLSIVKESTDSFGISVKTSTLAVDDEFDTIVLSEADHSCLLMWSGEKWVPLSLAVGGANSTFTGGTVTNATTFSNAVDVTTGGLTVDAGGLTVTAGGATVTAGGATITAGGLTVTAGDTDLGEDLYVRGEIILRQGNQATTDDGTTAVSAANILTGIVECTPTAARSKSTDTASNLVTSLKLETNGDSFDFSFINLAAATHAVTLSGGTGVTLVGNGVIDAATSARFRVRRTAVDAVTLYRLS